MRIHPRRSELRGVLQQVGEHLRKARGVHVQNPVRPVQFDVQLEVAGIDGRTVGLDGAPDDGRQRRRLGAQLDLSGGDARDIQQIVDEADHVAHLTLHHRAHALRESRLTLRALQQLDTGTNRNEWIAQLVGQHGNELILAAIGFAQLLLTHAQGLIRLRALDQVGRLTREHIEEAQLALGQAVPLPPVRGDHPERPAGAAQ